MQAGTVVGRQCVLISNGKVGEDGRLGETLTYHADASQFHLKKDGTQH